jgi:hypothetical protein
LTGKVLKAQGYRKPGRKMLQTQQSGSIDALMAAIESNDAAIIRRSAEAVVQSTFNHRFYTENPSAGDGDAMCTLLVAAAAIIKTGNRIPQGHKITFGLDTQLSSLS